VPPSPWRLSFKFAGSLGIPAVSLLTVLSVCGRFAAHKKNPESLMFMPASQA
jgi:hypothetical protein